MITTKDLAKLTQKKFREQTGLCVIEGEKLVAEHKDKILQTFNREPYGIVGVARIPNQRAVTFPYLVLDGIQDPGNVGTLLRTAKAFGFDTIFTRGDTADPWSQKVIRSAMGAQFGLNIIEGFESAPKDSELYIADMNGDAGARPKGKFGLVLGNEGNGVSAEIRALPHKIVSIPMKSDINSLNVAVAGGIIMHVWSQ